jgi:hypothetical protein
MEGFAHVQRDMDGRSGAGSSVGLISEEELEEDGREKDEDRGMQTSASWKRVRKWIAVVVFLAFASFAFSGSSCVTVVCLSTARRQKREKHVVKGREGEHSSHGSRKM